MKVNYLIMKLLVIVCLIFSSACNQIGNNAKNSDLPSHPRILLLKGEEAAIMQTISSDSIWEVSHLFIIDECNKLIGKPPVERILIGRRLLDKSREALRRIFFLSYAWRMTADVKYLDRAEEELLAVSSFTDWNPSHFLDVAEMTMAASIGYDWLYEELAAETRGIVKDAIREKGLIPSLDSTNNSWVKASHNWNQVCNAGMTYGALAIYEDQPELAVKIIDRAKKSILLPMEDYLPDGAYPEGYNYWGYGTSFNIMFLSAMEKVFGKEYGVAINPGFLKTAGYLEHMTGPKGNSFNYSDAGSGGGTQPAMFWFASQLQDLTLLWSEKYHLMNKDPDNDRLLPALMIWSAGLTMDKITAPSKKVWVGQGKNPVVLMRTSWEDTNAIFVGLKGGSPSVNHGHMDAGSFIAEAQGERWAMDFGMQNYNSLETAKVDLWNMAQNSQRWKVFRYNNLAHNTLSVNNELQMVDGYAPITSYSEIPEMMNGITDISSVYKGQLQKAARGIAIVDNQYITLRDEIETPGNDAVIRWNLLTSAEIMIAGNNSAVLYKNGKKLTIKVTEPSGIKMKTWSTVPTNSYDAPNPGTIMVGFEVKIPSNTKTVLNVLLLPEGATENVSVTGKNLDNWPHTSGNK
jgi:hypothetical protein